MATREITVSNPGLPHSRELDTDASETATLKAGLAVTGNVSATGNVTASGVVTSSRVQELTASGAVTAGKEMLELNHATVVIAATIADAADHAGALFTIKDTSASGTAAHTVTLTSGTFDGTNNIATLNAPGEQLAVVFGSDGNGLVILNTGSVALSS